MCAVSYDIGYDANTGRWVAKTRGVPRRFFCSRSNKTCDIVKIQFEKLMDDESVSNNK